MSKFLEILKKISFRIFNINYFSKNNKIIINKNHNYDNINIKFSNALIKTSNDEYIQLLNKKIIEFLLIMKKMCKNFDPTIFLTNFKNTLFKLENLNKDITDGVNGNIDFNERIVFNIKTFKVFNHEALHLSSILNGNIPKMLLPFFEGYTQLLTERYFNETPGVSYRLETMILKNLELILGKDLMETLFFKGNFQEIISELYKYESEKNIQSFIVSFNVLFDIHENYDFVDKTELFQHHLNVVFEFLFSCLKNKIDNIDNFSEIQRILFLGEWYPTITITTNKKCLSFSTLNSNLFNEFVNQVLYNNYVNKNKRH